MILSVIPVYVLRQFNLPFQVYNSYIDYKNELIKYDKYLGIKNSSGFTEVNYFNDKQTCIVIIGESTNRHHMSLYGYYRQTNPLLEKIKNEIFIFDNIISPHSHTIQSLEKAFTLGNYEEPKKKLEGSIIQLMKKAEFKTYWISNQRPLGAFETLLTITTKACDKRYFMNTLHNDYKYTFDSNIFIPLKKVLSDSVNKKMVFIHLLGNHAIYSRRYPENFNVFRTKPKSKYNHEKAYNTINTYDNAVLYNDYIISNIIEMVKSQNNNAFVLYFSDHGEDVYDSINFACHEENLGTKYMIDIPFILWVSDKYRKNNHEKVAFIDSCVYYKYMIDDLIHSIADLANVTFRNYVPERSVFNKKFKYRKRIIKSNKTNYDEL